MQLAEPSPPLRVVLADDHTLLRAGIAQLLHAAGIEVVGEAKDANELLTLVDTLSPDVAVVDIRMPPTNTLEGLEAARTIRQRSENRVGIVLLSQYVEARHAIDLLADGAAGIGYLLKDRVLDPADLVAAIKRVAHGGSALDPLVVEQLLKRHRDTSPIASLTDREREILSLMAEGLSNSVVASRLFVSEKTVESASTRIFVKLGLEGSTGENRRVQAVLTYLRSTA